MPHKDQLYEAFWEAVKRIFSATLTEINALEKYLTKFILYYCFYKKLPFKQICVNF